MQIAEKGDFDTNQLNMAASQLIESGINDTGVVQENKLRDGRFEQASKRNYVYEVEKSNKRL